jgi:hypothetical protein
MAFSDSRPDPSRTAPMPGAAQTKQLPAVCSFTGVAVGVIPMGLTGCRGTRHGPFG